MLEIGTQVTSGCPGGGAGAARGARQSSSERQMGLDGLCVLAGETEGHTQVRTSNEMQDE